ncbi:unnamed protein product [Musa hybrid cultivar]
MEKIKPRLTKLKGSRSAQGIENRGDRSRAKKKKRHGDGKDRCTDEACDLHEEVIGSTTASAAAVGAVGGSKTDQGEEFHEGRDRPVLADEKNDRGGPPPLRAEGGGQDQGQGSQGESFPLLDCEEDHRRFEELLQKMMEQEEEQTGGGGGGGNKELPIGIKDWWTRSKYAYLNQPTIVSTGETAAPKRPAFVPLSGHGALLCHIFRSSLDARAQMMAVETDTTGVNPPL